MALINQKQQNILKISEFYNFLIALAVKLKTIFWSFFNCFSVSGNCLLFAGNLGKLLVWVTQK